MQTRVNGRLLVAALAMVVTLLTGTTVYAQRQNKSDDQAQYGRTWIGGRVTAVNGVQVTIQRHDENASHTFVVTQSTIFNKRGGEQAVYSDVQVGDHVRVEGGVQKGYFLATHVGVFDEHHGEREGRGGFGGQRRPQ